MPHATIRGVRLNYEVVGVGGPWVALTTGGRRGHEELLPLARKLASQGYRVLLHDRRNTGASDIVIGGGPSEEEIWADDLAALLASLGAAPAFVGGSSSGARLAMLTCLRHPDAVRGLLLLRVTGGAFAAERLPETYYGQFIRAARDGGMAAVCATEQYRERIAANPASRDALMAMDPRRYVEVMTAWRDHFAAGAHHAVMGVSEAELNSITVPTVVIPGNDKTHSSVSGLAAHRLIPGSELHRLPVEDQDVDLIPFDGWAPHYDEIVRVLAAFVRRVEGSAAESSSG